MSPQACGRPPAHTAVPVTEPHRAQRLEGEVRGPGRREAQEMSRQPGGGLTPQGRLATAPRRGDTCNTSEEGLLLLVRSRRSEAGASLLTCVPAVLPAGLRAEGHAREPILLGVDLGEGPFGARELPRWCRRVGPASLSVPFTASCKHCSEPRLLSLQPKTSRLRSDPLREPQPVTVAPQAVPPPSLPVSSPALRVSTPPPEVILRKRVIVHSPTYIDEYLARKQALMCVHAE
ncbi:hypothetical protein CB1_001860002 [Camelus ferus]|nr:hypothetical protein CB1_001860002 [Camelus ferus]